MKKLLLLFVTAFTLGGCTQEYKSHDFDMAQLEGAFDAISKAASHDMAVVPESKWPDYLSEIGAESVYVTEKGIYIELDRFVFDEIGVFRPFGNLIIDPHAEDPPYQRMSGSIYSYRRGG
uniref:hypothetical protein n=1 Tax=Thaumasiovibrio occultus TaxID=1891184 RepID=UPI000B361691|nr:hypothetical protein [Thaumasiovibrio occultus]